MKKHLNLSNIFFLIVSVYAAYSLLPVLQNNLEKEGLLISSQKYKVIDRNGTNQELLFPTKSRSIAIFWATWCAPCKMEMARLSASVKDGKIPIGAIIAINPFESSEVVRSFLKTESHPFTFIEDNGISQLLKVDRTPTTMFIENQTILNLSSGLSFIGIWKAERFL